MWMNEGEIDRATEVFASHPVLGKGAKFLAAFRDEVNAHSDGWPYWKLPAQAADKLMTLLQGHMFAGMGAYPRLPKPTDADLNKAIAPIKAFYTRKGYKAGMKLPSLSDVPLPPFSVGRNDGKGKVTRHATLAEAEARIVQIEKTDPAGVHAGDYYVDGPEELINPPKLESAHDLAARALAAMLDAYAPGSDAYAKAHGEQALHSAVQLARQALGIAPAPKP